MSSDPDVDTALAELDRASAHLDVDPAHREGLRAWFREYANRSPSDAERIFDAAIADAEKERRNQEETQAPKGP